MLPSSSMKHHMELRNPDKNASDQVPRRKNQIINDQRMRRCEQEASDRAVALM